MIHITPTLIASLLARVRNGMTTRDDETTITALLARMNAAEESAANYKRKAEKWKTLYELQRDDEAV